MKHRFLSFFIVVGIAVIGQSAEAAQEAAIPQPKVDERVELLGILFRLAGASEYQVRSFKEYDDAINQHFTPFKEHPAVLAAQSLRSTVGISYDAVMSYAVHISIDDGRVVFPDENSEKTLKELDSRWTHEAAQSFAKQLNDFYVQSRFREFFETHHGMYQQTEAKIKTITDTIDYSWFARFYGEAHLERFHIVTSCISEQGNYGVRCYFKDGNYEYFAILSTPGPSTDYNENLVIILAIHEFNHSFCNPLVEKYLGELRPAALLVWPIVEPQMRMLAYGSPDTMLYEYLVTACEVRFWLGRGQKEDLADYRTRLYRSRGFLWIVELVNLLGEYESNRDKYPTLGDFMPEIVKMQNALVTEEYLADLKNYSPKITAINPPNGAKDVELNVSEISVTFDRPMGAGMMWFTRGEHEPYPKHDAAVWSADGLTCTGRNVGPLEPGTTYHIWFNYEGLYGFRCANGIPLKPVHYTFTTKAE